MKSNTGRFPLGNPDYLQQCYDAYLHKPFDSAMSLGVTIFIAPFVLVGTNWPLAKMYTMYLYCLLCSSPTSLARHVILPRATVP